MDCQILTYDERRELEKRFGKRILIAWAYGSYDDANECHLPTDVLYCENKAWLVIRFVEA